jgi:hypothetical protein
MKTSLFFAAVAACALTVSAAQAQTVGHLGVGAATTNVVAPGPNADFQTYQVEGAAKFDVGSLGALVDGSISALDGDLDDTDYTATAHLNAKLGNGLLGAFGGVDTSDDLTIWSLGVEGQAALTDQVTLYGQAGWGDIDDLSGADLWALRGELRYFASENFKLQAQAGYLKLDTKVGDVDGWSLGGEAEYQFAGTPWSVLAGYDYADSDDLGGKTHTFKVGARYTFGAPSLKARDAAGADLGSVRRLFSGALGL